MKKVLSILLILMIISSNYVLVYANNIDSEKNEETSTNTTENVEITEDSTKKEEVVPENVITPDSNENLENTENDETNDEQGIMTIANNVQDIINGTYRISISDKNNSHMALEIENSSKMVGANVQIGQWFNKDNDKNKFQITYDPSDDTYIIKSKSSGNVLDVQNGETKPGTNVWQYETNGTDAQKWKAIKNSDGSYSFTSKKSGLYLSVSGNNFDEGQNIEINKKSDKANQKFTLINLDQKPPKTLEKGIYKIGILNNAGLALEIQGASVENGGNVRIGKWYENTSNIQRSFQITYEDDGYYTIKSLNSGKVLEVQNGGITEGSNVAQYDENYTDAQRWQIVRNSDGKSYSFINKKSGLYLDTKNGNLSEGTNIQINSKMDNSRQKFEVTEIKTKQLKENGTYRISISDKNNSHMALEVENASKIVGANVQIGQWFNKDNDKNKFQITYDPSDDTYTIKSKSSGNVLDVQSGATAPGTNVWQYETNGTDAQKWKIIINDDGSYSFISKKSGLYLSVEGNNFSEGQNIEINNKNNKANQKFTLTNLDKKPSKVFEKGTYKIATSTNPNMVIGLSGNTEENGANAGITEWKDVSNGEMKFDLIYNEDDGYYTIENLYSGKVLEAQGGKIVNSTNVAQYDENYTDAQRWQIIKNSDNKTYSLINKKSGLYLSVESTSISKGKNVEIYEQSSSKEQKFIIEPVSTTNEKEYVEEGTYKIKLAAKSELSVDVKGADRTIGANVQVGSTGSTIRNEFNIIPDGNGYYTIRSVNSGNVLDVESGGTTNRSNVWQYEENGTDAQKWLIRKNSDGTVNIISKKSGLYLDIANGEMSAENNIWVYEGNNTIAQKFILEKQSSKTEQYIEEGLYKISTKLNNNKAFDIENESVNDGAIVQIWTYKGLKQQQFHINYENGYYYITNIKSNKVVASDGQNVKQYQKDSSKDNQKWILKKEANGYYSFISKDTKQSITVPNGNQADGTDLKMQTANSNNYQLFKIENAGINIDESKYPGIKDKIDELMRKHPNWHFEILYTQVDFDSAVGSEYDVSKHRCLLSSYSYQGAWLAPNPYVDNGWYSASSEAVAYFMDARNFLNETDVFQFLDANSYVSNSVSINGIQAQVNGTFLQNYANDVNNACRIQNVNPYFVLARLFQEQGKKGSEIGTGMDGGDGKTYYNPYNIGAQLGNERATALQKAKENGWDTMEKALVGGIEFLKKNWLANYQNTLYQNKFDIDYRSGATLYTHQYMQNLSAPLTEGRTLRNCYSSTNTLDAEFTFIIPVFEKMGQSPSAKPSSSSNSSISGPMDARVINVDTGSSLNLREEANTSSTIKAKIKSGAHLISIKRAINGNWQQVVTDDGQIGYVSGEFVEFIPDIIQCYVKKSVKTNDGTGVKIRIGPSIHVDQAGAAIPDGTQVTSINTGTYYIDGYWWDRIILNDGRQAFTPTQFLK